MLGSAKTRIPLTLGGATIGIVLAALLMVLIFVAAFFVLAPAAAKLMSVVIKRFDASSEIPGLIPTTIVSLVLFFAWLAHAVGAPELLGGFAAGLALSRRFFLPLGITHLIVLQALVNMCVCLGLLPTKGLTMPLMSFGGSSLITCCAAIGIILRADLEQRRLANRPKGRARRVRA